MWLKKGVAQARNKPFHGNLCVVLARPRRKQFDPLGTKYFVQSRDEGILLQVAQHLGFGLCLRISQMRAGLRAKREVDANTTAERGFNGLFDLLTSILPFAKFGQILVLHDDAPMTIAHGLDLHAARRQFADHAVN